MSGGTCPRVPHVLPLARLLRQCYAVALAFIPWIWGWQVGDCVGRSREDMSHGHGESPMAGGSLCGGHILIIFCLKQSLLIYIFFITIVKEIYF